MNWKIIALVVMTLTLASTAFAYAGFNRVYYTNNYQPSVYYANPAVTPSYASSSFYYPSTYAYSTYSYPNYYGGYAYTSYYTNTYPSTITTVYPAYPVYPSYPVNYSNVSLYYDSYGSGSSWGITVGRGSVCSYYGYC